MTDWIARPGGVPAGSMSVPGDKSISHRALMLGALADGETRIGGILRGADCLATAAAMRALGAEISGLDSEGAEVRVRGVGLQGLREPADVLDLGNSGTSMRLLSGILAGQPFISRLTGDASLRKRPMRRVTEPLERMGAHVETSANGTAPMAITGRRPLRAISYELPVASAQIKSAVLLAGLFADGRTRVIEPAPTRDHTERMLEGFGYSLVRDGAEVSLAGGGHLQGRDVDVPADISSAAFFMVAAAIVPGARLCIRNVGVNPTRTGILHILERMGAGIALSNEHDVAGEPVADISVSGAELRAIEIDAELVPLAIDELPVAFIAAACAEGETVVRDAEELRVKESDRIATMAAGLTALGVEAEPRPDGIRIRGGRIGGGEINSHGDHRIAMSFAVAAQRAVAPITIRDTANVATSFPDFLAIATAAGLNIEVMD